MNVYTYMNLELADRGWFYGANGQSVFHEHPTIDKLLEVLGEGDINVLTKDYKEIDLIKAGDFKKLDALN